MNKPHVTESVLIDRGTSPSGGSRVKEVADVEDLSQARETELRQAADIAEQEYQKAQGVFDDAKSELARLAQRQADLNQTAATLFAELKVLRGKYLDGLIDGAKESAKLVDTYQQSRRRHSDVLAAIERLAEFRMPAAQRAVYVAERDLLRAQAWHKSAVADLRDLERLRLIRPLAEYDGGASFDPSQGFTGQLRDEAARAIKETERFDDLITEHDKRQAQIEQSRRQKGATQ